MSVMDNILANIANVQYCSLFPIDKIVWKHNGEYDMPRSVPDGSEAQILTIPHHLNFIPLPKIIYSNNGFKDKYMGGLSPTYFDAIFNLFLFRYRIQVAADIDNIYVLFDSYDGPNRFFFKILAVAPDKPELSAFAPINDFSDEDRAYNISSLFNYQKVWKSDRTQEVDIVEWFGSSDTYTFDIQHNLNRIPQAWTFLEYNGRVQETQNAMRLLIDNGNYSIDANTRLTNNNLFTDVINTSAANRLIRLHYKIYADS